MHDHDNMLVNICISGKCFKGQINKIKLNNTDENNKINWKGKREDVVDQYHTSLLSTQVSHLRYFYCRSFSENDYEVIYSCPQQLIYTSEYFSVGYGVGKKCSRSQNILPLAMPPISQKIPRLRNQRWCTMLMHKLPSYQMQLVLVPCLSNFSPS